MATSFHKFEQQMHEKHMTQTAELEACKVAYGMIQKTLFYLEESCSEAVLQTEIIQQLQKGPVYTPTTRYFPEISAAEADKTLSKVKRTTAAIDIDIMINWSKDRVDDVRLNKDWKACLNQLVVDKCPPNTTLICRPEDIEFEGFTDFDVFRNVDSSDGWYTITHEFDFMLLQRPT